MSAGAWKYLAVASIAVMLGFLVVAVIPETLLRARYAAMRERGEYAPTPMPLRPEEGDVEKAPPEALPLTSEVVGRPLLDLVSLALITVVPLVLALAIYLLGRRRLAGEE